MCRFVNFLKTVSTLAVCSTVFVAVAATSAHAQDATPTPTPSPTATPKPLCPERTQKRVDSLGKKAVKADGRCDKAKAGIETIAKKLTEGFEKTKAKCAEKIAKAKEDRKEAVTKACEAKIKKAEEKMNARNKKAGEAATRVCTRSNTSIESYFKKVEETTCKKNFEPTVNN